MSLKIGFLKSYKLGLIYNKRKNSQFTLGVPLMIMLFVIFSGMLVFFVMDRLGSIKSLVREKELNNFAVSMDSILRKQSAKSYESTDEVVFSLPEDISSVCFVDNSKEIDKFAKKGLLNRLILDETKNMFLSPIEKNPSFKLENIELEGSNPLCVKTKQGKIKLKLTSKGDNSLVEAEDFSDKDIDCVSVVYNGEPEDKVDIVFLSYGYERAEEFAGDVNNYINNIFSTTEPFKENIDKFNFFRIDKEGSLGCSIKEAGLLQYFISCDSFSVKNVASECPNDYILVLADRSVIKDIIEPVRSSAFSNIAKINTGDWSEFVLLHEFGHIFVNLDDEYIDEEYYGGEEFSDSVNCKTSCGEFEGVDGVECKEGCSINALYRSSKESIMKDYYQSKEFMVWNTKIIEESIEEYE